MTAALGPQGVNPSPHFRAVMLCPRDRLTKFEAADRAIFRTEFWTLVAETHNGEILAVAAGEDVPRVRPLPDPREVPALGELRSAGGGGARAPVADEPALGLRRKPRGRILARERARGTRGDPRSEDEPLRGV